MIRRSFLKGMLFFFGASACLLLDEFKAVKVLLAGQVTPPLVHPKLPSATVRQAIQLNDSTEMLKFILAQPLQAEKATIADKLQMLKVLRGGCNFQGPPIEQVKREKASYILLKDEENNRANLAYITNGMGKTWIEQTMHLWRNDGLKRIVAKMISI